MFLSMHTIRIGDSKVPYNTEGYWSIRVSVFPQTGTTDYIIEFTRGGVSYYLTNNNNLTRLKKIWLDVLRSLRDGSFDEKFRVYRLHSAWGVEYK